MANRGPDTGQNYYLADAGSKIAFSPFSVRFLPFRDDWLFPDASLHLKISSTCIAHNSIFKNELLKNHGNGNEASSYTQYTRLSHSKH